MEEKILKRMALIWESYFRIKNDEKNKNEEAKNIILKEKEIQLNLLASLVKE